ncbi:TIM23 complex component [Saxophila tyrrhenica]|uniref:Presequence translocated-associated motor subunit PAM17 n=1 Tax=Saxophila tyrrhenica TaxID=1690608 RepID=A0AAV9PN46_9PEZI|nr:TIM23 complex component [Saxophila tyrrhenica]
MASLIYIRASPSALPTARHTVSRRAPTAQSPFSTSTRALKQPTPPSRRPQATQLPHRPLTAPTALALRQASTSSTPTSTTTPEDVLTWNRFFDLRRKRRYLNLGSSLITAGATIGVAGPIIAQQDIDGWAAQISGLDPIIVLGATTFAVAAGGWLCGPSFGTALFKTWAGRKGWNGAIAEKEKSFFARIRRYRADPASSSPQNPIPDYYGEKIASVKDYRRWLKDQRAFNLKKNKNML